jgi:hypothetical protein
MSYCFPVGTRQVYLFCKLRLKLLFFWLNREKDDLQPPVVVLTEAEVNHQKEAEERNKKGTEIVVAEVPEEVDENAEALKEAPFWFPDGWIIHVCRDDDGSTYRVLPYSACMLNYIYMLPACTLCTCLYVLLLLPC